MVNVTTNNVTKARIVNGTREYVMRYSIVGDGSGDLINNLVNVESGDCAQHENPHNVQEQIDQPLKGDARILSIEGALTGFSASLSFEDFNEDLVSYWHVVQLPSDMFFKFEWCKIGGIKNPAIVPTGNLVISTSGLGVNCAGDFVIRMRKH